VFTYYALDVTETLKENSERSSPEQIAQKVGQMSWGDYLIKASSDHHPLLTGHSYLMFLRWSDALQVFTVTPSGAFEITQGRVVPMGSSPVAREYADRSAIEFARLIRMKAMERSR
jgi:hypothetical protein